MTTPAHISDPGAAVLRAFTQWMTATATPTGVTAAVLTAEHPGHGMTRSRLHPTQAFRFADLLNRDTARIEAARAAVEARHNAAEAAHLKATQDQEKP